MVSDRPGLHVLEVEADHKLQNESGGHRVQRVPSGEKSGRVHTSTATVSVTPISSEEFILREEDVKTEFFSGTGAGGQHRNKKMCSVRMTHVPSGLTVTAQSRSRESNIRTARTELEDRLKTASSESHRTAENDSRRKNIGSGMRGDKTRTYRFRDDVVVDHVTGKKASCGEVMRGKFDKLWC